MSDTPAVQEPREQPTTVTPDQPAGSALAGQLNAAGAPDTAVTNTAPAIGSSPVDEIKSKDFEASVVEALRTVYDPEIPVNIYEMGLIYTIRATAEGSVYIGMTLTSPACPVAGSLPIEVEQKIRAIPGVTAAQVEIVWEPPWTPEMMSEGAKLQLGFM